MLHVEKSALAPRRVYRSFRTKLRYDIDHERGWAEHVLNVGSIQTIESPSLKSSTGRLVTTSGDILDDVDVSRIPP
jgi:hypothetical protein